MVAATRLKAHLLVLRLADRARRVFGPANHRYELFPCLSEKDVAAFEEAQGVALPAECRWFLTHVGNGGAGPGYGLFALDQSAAFLTSQPAGFLASPFPHADAWVPSPQSIDAHAG